MGNLTVEEPRAITGQWIINIFSFLGAGRCSKKLPLYFTTDVEREKFTRLFNAVKSIPFCVFFFFFFNSLCVTT